MILFHDDHASNVAVGLFAEPTSRSYEIGGDRCEFAGPFAPPPPALVPQQCKYLEESR